MVFQDRQDAGRALGAELAKAGPADCVVLALPRGGVPVAAEVAAALGAPLDVLVARKLGVPGHRELGFGAIAEGGVAVLNDDLVSRLKLTEHQIDAVVAEESAELERRVQRYRSGRPMTPVSGRVAVLVDDGLATGYTARAGLEALRKLGADHVVLAVPVGARETVADLEREGYDVLCLEAPGHFMAVGQWYRDFDQTSDAEVLALLGPGRAGGDELADPPALNEAAAFDVVIPAGPATLQGRLTIPSGASGVVIFAHGSGSSRLSPRNIEVADALNEAGLATLLFDLLTPDEASDRANVFDISLLGGRLADASNWLLKAGELGEFGLAELPLFYFGASTGAAAALVATARLGDAVNGVVSRGGRPDLAGAALSSVRAPVLLIVGGADTEVLALNRQAAARIPSEVELAIVPGAGHLFEELGALRDVSRIAAEWLTGLVGRS